MTSSEVVRCPQCGHTRGSDYDCPNAFHVAQPSLSQEAELTPDQLDDGWCVDCGEEFHYDDCGGYNPPCVCGAHCRSCHEARERGNDEWDDAYPDEDEEPR